MQWGRNRYHIVDFGVKRLKDHVELPSATGALVNDKLNLRLKWPQRLKSEVENQRLLRVLQAVGLLVDEH